MSKIKLTSDDVFNKKFKKNIFGGFATEEVDDFLNEIIKSFESLEKDVKSLKAENDKLRKENFQIKMEVIKTNDKNDFEFENKETSSTPIEIRDLEKRIIDLEREVAVINAKIEKK